MTVSGMRGTGGVDPAARKDRLPSARPASSSGANGIEDRVTLSSAARAPQIPEKFRGMSGQAHADPKLAEELAYNYAHSEQSPLIDLSDLEAGTGPAKYAATGEPVTAESELRYKEMSASLLTASASLYSKEKANGTADADILDKLLSMLGSQSDEFRTIIDLGT